MPSSEPDEFQDSLTEMLKVSPSPGLAYRIERAHVRLENTRPASASRKAALNALMRILHPYIDPAFRDGYNALVRQVHEMQERHDPRASSHYEDGYEILLNGLEFRKGFHGQKDIYDEPL